MMTSDSPSVRIELLCKKHRQLIKQFECRNEAMTVYLKRYAFRHAERDILARTYVAIHRAKEKRLAGYFSMAATSVTRASITPIDELHTLPKFPIPAILLARLAVDRRVEGQGLGRYLLEEALGLTLQLLREGPIAFRLLVVDAIDENAVQFYRHFGFQRLSDEFPCRMLLDLKKQLQQMDLSSRDTLPSHTHYR